MMMEEDDEEEEEEGGGRMRWWRYSLSEIWLVLAGCDAATTR